jgi:type II secretory pathway pseudopilin PulG
MNIRNKKMKISILLSIAFLSVTVLSAAENLKLLVEQAASSSQEVYDNRRTSLEPLDPSIESLDKEFQELKSAVLGKIVDKAVRNQLEQQFEVFYQQLLLAMKEVYITGKSDAFTEIRKRYQEN